MSDMVAGERRRFGFWLAIALLLLGAIVGLGIANRAGAASAQPEHVAGSLASSSPNDGVAFRASGRGWS